MPISLPKFDPSRPFVASRNFRYSGDIYQRGDAFPNDGVVVNERKLKQLYETRYIFYAGEETVKAIPPRSPGERRKAAAVKATEETPISDAAKAYANKRGNTHEVLFKAASGLEGVTKSMTKARIAQALIDAGRVDGTA